MNAMPRPVVAAFAAVLALAIASCVGTRPAAEQGGPTMFRPTGPVTAISDAEVFGQHPLAAFQRTGNPPLPITSLPANTPLALTGRSGAFYRMQLRDGSVGWIATRDVTGPVPRLPEVAPGAQPAPAPPPGHGQQPSSADPNAGGGDFIDLDRL